MGAILESALRYAARGWNVLPLHGIREGACTCGKRDCTSPGKHPLTQHGVKEATTNVEMIRHWFTVRWPHANIGIATGGFSRIVVMDIDGPEGELALKQAGDEPPVTLVSITGNGRHLVFKHPGLDMRNAVRILPKVDVRADGGYIVAPPSQHISGKQYEWEDWEIPVAPCPAWFVERVKRGSASGQNREISSALHGNEPIPDGMRNDVLFRVACKYRGMGLGRDEIAVLVSGVNRARCTPPLDAAEIDQIAASAAKYDPLDPQIIQAPDYLVQETVKTLELAGVSEVTLEKVRKEAKEAAVTNGGSGGTLELDLVRRVNAPGRGSVFDATIMFRGLQACLTGLSGDIVLNYRKVRAMALEEGMGLPDGKKIVETWVDLVNRKVQEAPVPRNPMEHALGACVVFAVQHITALAPGTREQFGKAQAQWRFSEDGFEYFALRVMMDRMEAAIRDAKRDQRMGALRILGITSHRIQVPGREGEKRRIDAGRIATKSLAADWTGAWWEGLA